METRFDAVDTRFDAIDSRLDALGSRLDAHLDRRASWIARSVPGVGLGSELSSSLEVVGCVVGSGWWWR